MAARKLVLRRDLLVQQVASEAGVDEATASKVLAAFGTVAERAMLQDLEVQVADLGYMRMAPPAAHATGPNGAPVTRGKRVTFREIPANRLRWK